MNEQLQQHMEEVVEYIKQGGDFVASQAPLYVQEVLAWYFWSSVMGVILCALGLALAGVLCWIASWIDSEMDRAFARFMLLLFSLLPAIWMCHHVYSAVKVSVAPRVVLMEQMADLVRVVK